MPASATSKQPKKTFFENIFLVSSNNDASVPSGKVYKVLNRKDKWFIVNKKGQRAHYRTSLFHATPPRSQRADYQGQSVSIVSDFAALRGKCPVVWATGSVG
jgi:hypothetical protein